MIEWRLFEVKQHKYKLVLGWVTVPLVVHLIDRDAENLFVSGIQFFFYDPSVLRSMGLLFFL